MSLMEKHTCFKVKLEATLSDELGKDSFNQLLSEVQNDLGILKRSHALKNPVVLERVIARAASNGKTSPTLKSIVEKIIALKPKPAIGL